MNGKQHRLVAPIFTAAISLIAVSTKVVSVDNMYAFIGTASAASLLTANLPDADLYATYPIRVLWGKGIKRVRRKGQIKTYSAPKGMHMRTAATVFKSLGVKRHRDWRTHSPMIHVPLGIAIIWLAMTLFKTMSIPLGLICGLVFGYWSHIAADIPNKGGIPLGLSNSQFSLPKMLLGDRGSNLFRSGNKLPVIFFIVAMIEITLFVISPSSAKKLNIAVYNLLARAVGFILYIIKEALSAIRG